MCRQICVWRWTYYLHICPNVNWDGGFRPLKTVYLFWGFMVLRLSMSLWVTAWPVQGPVGSESGPEHQCNGILLHTEWGWKSTRRSSNRMRSATSISKWGNWAGATHPSTTSKPTQIWNTNKKLGCEENCAFKDPWKAHKSQGSAQVFQPIQAIRSAPRRHCGVNLW